MQTPKVMILALSTSERIIRCATIPNSGICEVYFSPLRSNQRDARDLGYQVPYPVNNLLEKLVSKKAGKTIALTPECLQERSPTPGKGQSWSSSRLTHEALDWLTLCPLCLRSYFDR